MSKPRKRSTISIEEVKAEINRTLLNSVDDYKQGREAIGITLEQLLLDTGNYKGFRSLSAEDMKKSISGTTFGIRLEYIHTKERDAHGNMLAFKDTDHTRKHYY